LHCTIDGRINFGASQLIQKRRIVMNEKKRSIRDNWPEIKIRMKENYPQLTEADLKYIDGFEDELFKNLQLKTRNNRKELLMEFNEIMQNHKP